MGTSASAPSLSEYFVPLAARLGNRVTVRRDGESARWSYAGQSVVVKMRANGALAASFIERPSLDRISARRVKSLYQSAADYGTTGDGAARLAADMVAFFSGMREPRFSFADALALE